MSNDLTPQDQAFLDIMIGVPSHAITHRMSEAIEQHKPWCIAYRDEVYRLGYGFLFELLDGDDVRVVGFQKTDEREDVA